MTKSRITAVELLAKLNADPEFVTKRAAEEDDRLRREAQLHQAEAPLIAELQGAGFRVQSAWDLANAPGSYPEAVPILLAHLQLPYPPVVREGIARALAVPEANIGWEILVRSYQEEVEPRVKSGLAVALAAAAGDERIDDIIALARERRYGPSRVLLLRAIGRSSIPGARSLLRELGEDPDLKREVRVILRRKKDVGR